MATRSSSFAENDAAIHQLPTEMIERIVCHLDKQSLLSLRLASAQIAYQARRNFKTRFSEIRFGLGPSELERLERLNRSCFSDYVQHLYLPRPDSLQFISGRLDPAPPSSTADSIEGDGQGDLEEFRAAVAQILGVQLPRLLGSFKNLQTLTLDCSRVLGPGKTPMHKISRLEFMSPMTDTYTNAVRLFAESLDTPLRLRLDFKSWLCEIPWKGDPLKTTQMAATWHPRLRERFLQNEDPNWEKFLRDQDIIGMSMHEELTRCPLRQRSSFLEHSHGPCTLRLHCIQLDSDTFAMAFYQATCEVDANTLTLYNYEHLGYNGSDEFEGGLLKVLGLCARRYGARRDLSIVRCKLPSFLSVERGTWFLKRLRAQSQMMERFRFEKVSGVFFDWDDNGNLDDGSRLQEMIRNFGLREALGRMIEAYRVREDLDCANLTVECHCTEEQKWSDGFGH